MLAGELFGGLAVVHEVKEGGVVHPAVVHVVALQIFGDELAVGVSGVLGVHMVARPVHTVAVAVVEVAVEVAFQVPLVVVVVGDVLLLHHALADVDVERLPGQHQPEELVAGRADGPDVGDVVIVGKEGHETGDAALHLDLKEHVRFRQAPLGPALGDVVHHHRGDALALGVIGGFFIAGEDVGLVRFRRGFRRGLHSGLFAAAGSGGLVAAAGGEQAGRHGQRQQDAQQTLHCVAPLYSVLLKAVSTPSPRLFHYNRPSARGQPFGAAAFPPPQSGSAALRTGRIAEGQAQPGPGPPSLRPGPARRTGR